MLKYYEQTFFLTSSIDYKCLNIINNKSEVAFIGYSNSGKSTLINCLTNNNKLSRCSKLPGRTVMINFFEVNQELYFVDLPGYGYSKIDKIQNKKINDMIFNYIKYRENLKVIILLIDIRRLLRTEDKKILHMIHNKYINLIIVLTKCDKISTKYQHEKFKKIKQQLNTNFYNVHIVLFSKFKKIGVYEIIRILRN